MAGAGSPGLAQTMGDQSVTIFVGPDRKRYLIHKELLTKQSKYFDKAFKGTFKEADEQSTHLEEESPATFDLLVGWLYQDHIPVAGQAVSTFGPNRGDRAAGTFGGSLFGSSFGESVTPSTVKAPNLFALPPVNLFSSNGSNLTANKIGTGFPAFEQNKGTVSIPYERFAQSTLELNPQLLFAQEYQAFDSISAQWPYRKWSAEELRNEDYKSSPHDLNNPRLSQLALAGTVPESSSSSVGENLFSSSGGAPIPTSSSIFCTDAKTSDIPVRKSLHAIKDVNEEHQIAVLQLVIFAEKYCWDNLFNRAMTAYVEGESNLAPRPLPISHIEIIQQHTKHNSTCREFASDMVIANLRLPSAQKEYLDWTMENPEFVEQIFKSLSRNTSLVLRDLKKAPKKLYHVCQRDPSSKDEPKALKKDESVGQQHIAFNIQAWQSNGNKSDPPALPNSEDDV